MLKGKTAVVTGASRGIGAAIAEKLAENGADIAVVYYGIDSEALEVQQRIEGNYGVRCKVYSCNVADGNLCKETVAAIISDFGGVDILVNDAGITRDNLLLTMPEEDFEAVVDVNLKGAFNMIKACGKNFLRKKYGKIINIASVSGLHGIAGQANYSASKAGVIALTKVCAKEMGTKNICCNAIAPGFIETDMTKDLNLGDDFIKTVPLRRLGQPQDIANLALFLASPASDYITGEVIRIDGGLAM